MHSKLNDSQILSIRSAYWSGTPVKEICKIYSISESTAYFWIAPNQYKEYAADLGMEIMIHKEFCDTQRSMQKLRKIVDILNDASVVLQSVKDYTNSYRAVLRNPGNKEAAKMMQECEDFIESRWFRMLCDLDPEELLYKIDQELEKAYGRRKR